MMYISEIQGGPELSGSNIERVIAKIYELRGPGERGPSGSLDVVFHIPGSLLSPEHSGVRTGRFSKRERMLQLQIAVPREVLDQEEHEMSVFLLDSLREAVRVAAPVFLRAKIPFNEAEYLSMISRIEAALVH